MYPKKSSEIIRQTAEEMNLSESKVDAVVSFYYKNLRKELSSLNHVKVNVPNLGYFEVKPTKVKAAIKGVKKKLEELKDPTFINHYNKIRLEEKLKTLENIQLKINDYLEERKKVRDEQVKYYMEKQKTNNGGN
jgi:nucleoid DNA-binding protein